jgi:hypothetical protein
MRRPSEAELSASPDLHKCFLPLLFHIIYKSC